MAIFKTSSHRGGTFVQSLLPFFWPVIILAIAAGLFWANGRFLKVRQINCRAGDSACPEAIKNLTEDYLGRSLLFLRRRELVRSVIATGLAGEVKISVSLPGQLNIDLTAPPISFFVRSVFGSAAPELSFVDSTISGQIIPPSVELAEFVATAGGKTFQLLESGVLDQAEKETPIYLIAATIPGKDYLFSVFSWLKAIASMHLFPETIYLLPQMLVVKVKDQPDYLFSLASDPGETLLALQRLISAITISKLSVIDFRYSNPILK